MSQRTRAFKDVQAKPVKPVRQRQYRVPHRWLPIALAVSLGLSAGLGFLVFSQYRALRSSPVLVANPEVFILNPEGVATRGPGETVKIPAFASFTVLALILFDPPKVYADYCVDLKDRQGRVLWSSTGIQQNRFGNFTVGLPRQSLPPASYSILLYGLEAGERELLATYRFDSTTSP